MSIKKIVVLGAGIMGSGIAQLAAQSGFSVLMVDVDDQALDKGIAAILKSLGIFREKGKISQAEFAEIRNRIDARKDMKGALAEADFVVEAVPENMELKKKIFRRMDEICKKGVVLATNTSSLSITEIASVVRRQDKVVGMHFANPVPIMIGVEIIRGLETSQETLETIYSLAEKFEKICYTAKDFPGFAGNRMLMPLINEAFHVLFQGISSAEDIDNVCKLSFRHPMGPLELADFTGLDTVLFILEYLHKEIGERYRPCPLIKQLVMGGQLGVKTGKGVYDYTSGSKIARDLS